MEDQEQNIESCCIDAPVEEEVITEISEESTDQPEAGEAE